MSVEDGRFFSVSGTEPARGAPITRWVRQCLICDDSSVHRVGARAMEAGHRHLYRVHGLKQRKQGVGGGR